MNFDEAYQRMKEGAAIARPHWKRLHFFFWARGGVWIATKSGTVRPLAFFNQGLTNATDWFIVELESLPTLPEPKPKPVATRKRAWRSLEDKQAEMRQRCGEVRPRTARKDRLQLTHLPALADLARAAKAEREAEKAFFGLPFEKERQKGDAIMLGLAVVGAKKARDAALEALEAAGFEFGGEDEQRENES